MSKHALDFWFDFYHTSRVCSYLGKGKLPWLWPLFLHKDIHGGMQGFLQGCHTKQTSSPYMPWKSKQCTDLCWLFLFKNVSFSCLARGISEWKPVTEDFRIMPLGISNSSWALLSLTSLSAFYLSPLPSSMERHYYPLLNLHYQPWLSQPANFETTSLIR